MLTISVLMENTPVSESFAAEHGLSFLLESDKATILFDTGQSTGFLDNATRMGANLGAVTDIVISHGHYDHTGGLGAALRHLGGLQRTGPLPLLTAHPDILRQRRRVAGLPQGGQNLGMPDDSRKEIAAWPTQFSKDPVWLHEDIVFLGEIPRLYPEQCVLLGETPGTDGYKPDTLADDTAIAYVTPKGLIVVAGCSHSGIINIIEHAKTVTGVGHIHAVYGGLHCKHMDPAVFADVWEALSCENFVEICAFHCTGDVLDGFPGHVRLAAGMRHRVP